jgi:hypothetical protein
MLVAGQKCRPNIALSTIWRFQQSIIACDLNTLDGFFVEPIRAIEILIHNRSPIE